MSCNALSFRSVGETSGRRSFLLRKHAPPYGEHQPPAGPLSARPGLHARALDTPRKRLRSVYDILRAQQRTSAFHPFARTSFHQQRLIARIRSTLLPHSCNTSSVRMRSVPEEPAKHEGCFQDTPSMFQKREWSVPVPAMRIPLFQERPGSVTLFQKRYRSVRGASVRREGEVLKRRRGGVLSFRTQEVLTGTGVKEMPPGCPGGVKVCIFRQNWPERGILTSTMPKMSDRVMAP